MTSPFRPKRRGRTEPSPNRNRAPALWDDPQFVGNAVPAPSAITAVPQRSVPPLPPEKIGSSQYQLPVSKERGSVAFSPTRTVLDRPSFTSFGVRGKPATGTPPAGQRLMSR